MSSGSLEVSAGLPRGYVGHSDQAAGRFQLKTLAVVEDLGSAHIEVACAKYFETVWRGEEDLLHLTPLDYPSHVRENNIQGTVVLETVLDDNGHVCDARVVDGPMQLRRIALAAVLAWHFAPVKEGTTRQVAIRYQLPMSTGPNPKGLTRAVHGRWAWRPRKGGAAS